MYKDIVIYGAGGFGREVHQLIDQINTLKKEYNILGFIDDSVPSGSLVNGLPILGGINFLKKIKKNISVAIAIASPSFLKNFNSLIENSKINYPNLIHPSVIFDYKHNQIGFGNIITYNCHLTRNIRMGNFNLLNTRVSFGHDVSIGSFNVFMPNVQISGGVNIKDSNFFGLNSSVLQDLNIGNNNIINACTLLTKNIPDNRKYFGIPGRRIN